MSEKDIKSKRDLFCCLYAALGNAEEAAVKAGFGKDCALSEAAACLRISAYRKKISALRNALCDDGAVISGLRRLAFGSCSDAVILALADDVPSPEQISQLDLFNVSEIKRIKGGSIEIKLFDRLKALEKLFELQNSFDDRGKASALVQALTASAETEVNCDDL